MKKRTSNFIMSIFTLAAGDFIYFLWQPYPKSIIKFIGSTWVIQDLITNLFYFALFLSALVFMTEVIVRPGARNVLFSKLFTRKLILLFVVQIGVDCVQFAGARLLPQFSVFVYNVCSVLCWCLFAVVLMPRDETSEKSRFSFRRVWIALGIAALVILICSVLLDVIALAAKQNLYARYSSDSRILTERIRNNEFRSELRNVLVDFSCGIVFLIGVKKCGEFSKDDSYDEKLPRNTSVIVFRMIVLINTLTVLCLIKPVICPNGTVPIGGIGFVGEHRETYREVEGIFDMTKAEELGVVRLNGNGKQAEVFVIFKNSAWYNSIERFKFTTDGDYASWASQDPKDEFYHNGWQKFIIGSENVAVFDGREILWTEDGEVYHISLKKLSSCKENSILSELCRERIAFGDWRFFEYGCEYLLKYDADFILPYMERYAQGEFAPFELEYSKDYNPEYIQAFAANMIQEHIYKTA